jgi:signal transduction histidine kinase
MTQHILLSRKSAAGGVWVDRYRLALAEHLTGSRARDCAAAQVLGRAALKEGLATLDIARMHEAALVALAASFDSSDKRSGLLRRAGGFFAQAILPLEKNQRVTRETNRSLRQRNETLRLHTAELAAGNRRLEREVARRKAGEATIRQGREQYRRLYLESQVMQKKLRQLTRQILSAQEEERKTISRELHDEVVQTLVGINVQLSALGRGASTGLGELRTKIARTRRLVESSVKAVHRFARDLRPAVLDDLGLIPALHAYGKGLANRKKLKIDLTAFAGVEALKGDSRTVLFRVAQEALTNVARHAAATRVGITIAKAGGTVRMEIADNGKAFSVERILLAKNRTRLGLVGMRERVEMVGGTLDIDSVAGRGTRVCAVVPFKLEANA